MRLRRYREMGQIVTDEDADKFAKLLDPLQPWDECRLVCYTSRC